MARPVKETPILSGEHAKRFAEQLKQNETKKVPKEEFERASRVFQSISRK